MNLILIRGLPGSGKSTLAKQLTNHLHFEADQFFTDANGVYTFVPGMHKEAHALCLNNTRICLESGLSAVVSNTFTCNWEMQPYFDLCVELGIVPLVVEAKGQFQNVHSVPDETLQRMAERWETLTFSAVIIEEPNRV